MRRLVPALPQAGAWGSIAAPGRSHAQLCADRARIVHGRSYAYGRLQINALTWGVRTLPFGQCGVWSHPSPKLALGAPLRRRDARTTKLPRSGADCARALWRLRAIANQCVDLGSLNLALWAMRRLVPALPQAGAWGSIAVPGRAHNQITAFRRGLGTGAPTLTGDWESMRGLWGVHNVIATRDRSTPSARTAFPRRLLQTDYRRIAIRAAYFFCDILGFYYWQTPV